MRRGVFLELGGFDESFRVCEDFEFSLRYLARHAMGLVPEALAVKRSGGWRQLSAEHSLDIPRIRAVLKTVRNETLNEREMAAARKSCEDKYAILLKGAMKRNRADGLSGLREEIDQVFAGA